jgi:predicted DCC family thiol-disulfide oxidoreductase YuxK
MIFDGDCHFCRRWIARWQQTTGGEVEYVPFQDARLAEQFPELARERFEQAVHLVEPDGDVYAGAEAAFRVLRFTPTNASRSRAGQSPREPLGWWLYQRAPAWAAFSEWAYRLVAGHRFVFSFLTRLLWGRHVERPTHAVVRWVFLRGLGLVYLIAFASLWTQIVGLIGRNGILPAEQVMTFVGQQMDAQQIGWDRYRLQPTLCWLGAGDGFLRFQCAAGVTLAALVLAGVAPVPCLCLLWVLYLSLATICEVFLGYQWDNLLLEAGFLAIFFAPARLLPNLAREWAPSRIVLWLFRWLVFRLMFESGCVKLLSGDATWRNFTALSFHYETQPLPTWLGWYAHQLPAWVQKGSVVLMFGAELLLPFLIFLPRRPRIAAAWGMILLMALIGLTGNYTFFNLLAVVLCFTLFDDAALSSWLPGRWRERLRPRLASMASAPVPANRWLIARRVLAGTVGLLVVSITTLQVVAMFQRRLSGRSPLVQLYQWVLPLRTFNNYGLFAVMTTSRPEIIVEGSNDRQTWRAYEFRHKPGDLKRRPAFVAPHQPRLDWQMWFAALGTYRQNPWFINFCYRLLEGSPEVLGLLGRNPFPEQPPRYIRASFYDYHFTDFAARRRDGAWWRREFKGLYCPVLSLPSGRERAGAVGKTLRPDQG